MKAAVVTRLVQTDALPDGQGGFVKLETSAGPLELRFTYEDAEHLVEALQSARREIQARRAHAGEPPLVEKLKIPASCETAVDPVNQLAVLLARFPDQTTQEIKIPRQQIAAIADALKQALKRFEAGAEWRQ